MADIAGASVVIPTDNRGSDNALSQPHAVPIGVRLNKVGRYSALGMLLAFFAGVLVWAGFQTAVGLTNTLEFCTTCHEMRDTVYQEYKQSVHYSNASGVRAICPDCHVPREWSHMIARKVEASLELRAKFAGTIDTREKFEARRLTLANLEWDRLKRSNSRECRNCHAFDAMSPALQRSEPYKRHMQARAQGRTCIDCHKGVAHKLPEGYTPNQP